MINPKDISVVVQGINIKHQTKRCIKSIRKYLPGATIIFSTYKNHNVDGLDYDVLVESDDPGATKITKTLSNMTNRILVTSKAGLGAVKTKYVIRMRSDLIFTNSKILNDIAKQFPKRDKKYSIFKERVLFYSIFSRYQETLSPKFVIDRPFDLSDWLCFGLTEDVKDYYDCPLTNEPDFSLFYEKNTGFKILDKGATWKFPPEQWVGMNFFSRYFPECKMKDQLDYTLDKVQLSHILLANNVISVGFNEIGVYIQKKTYKKLSKNKDYLAADDWIHGIYLYPTFVKDYKRYCDESYKDYYNGEYFENLKEHFANHYKIVVRPFCRLKKIRHYIADIISCFWYGGAMIKYKIQNRKKRL